MTNDTENKNPSPDREVSFMGRSSRMNLVLGASFLALAAAGIVFVVIDGQTKSAPVAMTKAEDEQFQSPGEAEPYIANALPQPDGGEVRAPDRMALEQERALREEAVRMVKERQKRQVERIHSPQVVFDQSADTGPIEYGAGSRSKAGGADDAGMDSDGYDAFAKRHSNEDVETAFASRLPHLGALVPQGTIITGILETAIQSDLPGMVRAVVSEDIYAFDHSQLLVPKGTRLIGRYRSGLVRGQSRIFVIWTRLLSPDGVSINIGSPGTDALGRAGMGGEVDTHFFERFGGSILMSLIDTGMQIGVNAAGNENTATLALESGDDFSDAANIALQNSVSIPPTVYVDQGTKINVFVGKDLDFSHVQRQARR